MKTKENLTKREIILTVMEKNPTVSQYDIKNIVKGVLETIIQKIQDGHNVELRNFGTLTVETRKARIGRNPKKPEDTVMIPERQVVKFRMGKELKMHFKRKSTATTTDVSTPKQRFE